MLPHVMYIIERCYVNKQKMYARSRTTKFRIRYMFFLFYIISFAKKHTSLLSVTYKYYENKKGSLYFFFFFFLELAFAASAAMMAALALAPIVRWELRAVRMDK